MINMLDNNANVYVSKIFQTISKHLCRPDFASTRFFIVQFMEVVTPCQKPTFMQRLFKYNVGQPMSLWLAIVCQNEFQWANRSDHRSQLPFLPYLLLVYKIHEYRVPIQYQKHIPPKTRFPIIKVGLSRGCLIYRVESLSLQDSIFILRRPPGLNGHAIIKLHEDLGNQIEFLSETFK